MKQNNHFENLISRRNSGRKSLAVLVDPDKISSVEILLSKCKTNPPDLFLVGSSFKGDESVSFCISKIRSSCNVPIILFPGNMNQVVSDADAILLLSVISSRNSELLIGKHVEAALKVKESGLEVIPTGYILVESGKLTSVHYMSQSMPVPNDKPELAAATALAGQQLGLQAIYLEAGSGAENVVPAKMIHAVKSLVNCLLFAGGGITTPEQLSAAYSAGADVAVIGNKLEAQPELILQFAAVRDQHYSE
jgi:putative glycerol-1-phosphate prenyltransferase